MKETRQPSRQFTVGILGGMGPLAGVEMHRLIVEATPAATDQDHMQVVLLTNPAIPDRTKSLREDDGLAFATAAGESARKLEAMGIDVIVMACMTAHSRLKHIQAQTHVPILGGIPLVHSALLTHYPKKRVALLATPGAIESAVYTENSSAIDWLIPKPSTQQLITDAIYQIKGGALQGGIRRLLQAMYKLGTEEAEVFILGCTELGLLYTELQNRGFNVVDPMRLMAQQLATLHHLHRSAAESTPDPMTASV